MGIPDCPLDSCVGLNAMANQMTAWLLSSVKNLSLVLYAVLRAGGEEPVLGQPRLS